ncbi:MAG: hypothetical protein LBR06_10795 [Bacteroidales bacterium]|jgi:hypothetical protein|nr:hypothetical protein [Bacteroidales bacterium]
MKKVLIFSFALFALFALCECSKGHEELTPDEPNIEDNGDNNNGGDNNGDSGNNPPAIMYSEVITPPTAPTIDESDYTSFDGMPETDFAGNSVKGINYLGAFAR